MKPATEWFGERSNCSVRESLRRLEVFPSLGRTWELDVEVLSSARKVDPNGHVPVRGECERNVKKPRIDLRLPDPVGRVLLRSFGLDDGHRNPIDFKYVVGT